ncbi:MAG: hypothetical protein E6G92_07820 [Alphaproteobacteria bacterium]|nr:MAG: hypothetical protein E6G92_07820 [Alphaproteobacteria bacterium]
MNYYFVALLAICSAYALAVGGAPERIAAASYALSCGGTHFALASHAGSRWLKLEVGVLIIDFLIFACFCVLASRADRFWPIWASALLGLGVLGHLARWLTPNLGSWPYAVSLTIWSYPILFLMALGAWTHRRRLARFGEDRPWTLFSA